MAANERQMRHASDGLQIVSVVCWEATRTADRYRDIAIPIAPPTPDQGLAMNRDALINQLLSDEGLRLKPYRCTEGRLTIGIGRNLDDSGITQDEAMYLLANDIRKTYSEVTNAMPWIVKLNDARQNVLLNMAFQMGTKGLLKFKQTLGHIQAGEFNQAATAMSQSLWAKQTPARAHRLAEQMRSGEL